ncbi:hypothetical protein J4447_02440 [Candidatus Pacearchaeota archaeon]|nr:hypothetical protein [Candidatus Pacearchaeota archaeon]
MALEGYCVKCREKREMKDFKISPTKRGTFMALGKCVKCGTKMAKIMSKEQAAKFK